MDKQPTRRLDTTNFYRVILPMIILLLAIFFIYLMFAMPDWTLKIPTIYPAKFSSATVVATV